MYLSDISDASNPMDLKEQMRASIIRAILESPEKFPEPLVSSVVALDQAKKDAAEASEDKDRAHKSWVEGYRYWQKATKVARRTGADRTQAEKKFRKMLTKHADELGAI